MKKRLSIILITGTLLLTTFACSDRISGKGASTNKAYFWTNQRDNEKHLFIDDNYRGKLPYLPNKLIASDKDIVKEKGLMISLPSGRYGILVKDSKENISSKGKLMIRDSRNNKEISSSWNNNQCMVEVVMGE